jgi:hypothetical protein
MFSVRHWAGSDILGKRKRLNKSECQVEPLPGFGGFCKYEFSHLPANSIDDGRRFPTFLNARRTFGRFKLPILL